MQVVLVRLKPDEGVVQTIVHLNDDGADSHRTAGARGEGVWGVCCSATTRCYNTQGRFLMFRKCVQDM